MTRETMTVPGRRDAPATPKKTDPLKILIVDDDPLFRLNLRRMLARGDAYRLFEAQHAEEAIALIERQRPDLVVSDIFMPVADGFELLNWMRSHAADVPVLVVSAAGHADRNFDPAVIAQHLGAVAVLSKPFDRADLIAAVDRALGG